ncbi:hypothetical protein M407DRAFT_241088 [Tulasnella calospora MUT 4182]|uniref:Uncharacterized protein n=1 Tax=Tulasnella calospora MUT 4182 TaxID=1051891 RepID=A0A0C3QKW8_9AGAM|nr:hypothetical protein M407DRAFT_241088 [Tulasnella calospora MUT 4182]
MRPPCWNSHEMIDSGSGARDVLRISDDETALVGNDDESLGKEDGTVGRGGRVMRGTQCDSSLEHNAMCRRQPIGLSSALHIPRAVVPYARASVLRQFQLQCI